MPLLFVHSDNYLILLPRALWSSGKSATHDLWVGCMSWFELRCRQKHDIQVKRRGAGLLSSGFLLLDNGVYCASSEHWARLDKSSKLVAAVCNHSSR